MIFDALAPRDILPESTIGLSWLVRLRWVAVVAQAILVVVATFLLAVPFSLPLVGALVGVTAISNFVLQHFSKRVSAPPTIFFVLVFDTLLLTGLLLLSGGPTNPFSVFYIVHVALGALLLQNRATYVLSIVTSLAFGSLFLFTDEASMHAMHHGAGFTAHLRGMWLSYTLAAFVVGYFVARVARALAEREREVARLRDLAARNEKLASLSTLAAGAAHELGTPLATIAVVAGELLRATKGTLDAAAIAEDAALLRSEAERCRAILQKMAGDAGQELGEAPREIDANEVVARTKELLSEERRTRLETKVSEGRIVVPPRALGQMLANLVGNAFDASEASNGKVSLSVDVRGTELHCTVGDEGSGMSAAVVERLGEPFFTTKPPQRGLGLGFFLVRTFAERFGGKVAVESQEGRGTRVSLLLPARFS